LAAFREAQRARVARIDAIARAALDDRATSEDRRHRAFVRYITTYRTLADPAYLDPSIDPDDRPLGSIFAYPDPYDANYGYGLARIMTPGAHHDGARVAVDLVRLEFARRAGGNDAVGDDPVAVRAPDRRHRDPVASSTRGVRPVRRARQAVRRDQGRRALLHGSPTRSV
jgi:hypothetical protein